MTVRQSSRSKIYPRYPERRSPTRRPSRQRASVPTRGSASFSIRGLLHAVPVTASWRDGYLMADEELSEQIDRLVDGDYTFRGAMGTR